MANNDRVLDLYLGRIHSPAAQNACRDRIHWLCRHAVGPRVLDLGCSQGVAAVILAREGCEVVGLDIEEETIRTAREALGDEPPDVQRRVEFVVGDAYQVEFEPGSFDSVVLGEVLEHLAQPERLLERVATWLRQEGRLAISVPLGFEPHHDHKQTFYLRRLLDLLTRHFCVFEVDALHGRFLCAAATKRDAATPHEPLAVDQVLEWLQRCDSAMESGEQRRYAERVSLQQQRETLREQLVRLKETIHSLETRVSRQAYHEQALRDRLNAAIHQEYEARKQLEQRLAQTQQHQAAYLSREAEQAAALAQARAAAGAAREEVERVRAAQRRLESELHSERDRAHRYELSFRREQTVAQSVRESLEKERSRRRSSEHRLNQLKEQYAYTKATLELREQEVRYRLGDALVSAVRPSRNTLLLPVRIARLFAEGLSRIWARRRAARQRRREASPSEAAQSTRHELHFVSPGRPAPDGGGTPRFHEVPLPPPFGDVPDPLVRRKDLRIAGVMDEFSWRAWQYEASLRTFTPDDWRKRLEEIEPHLLFVESAWSGIEDRWRFQLRELGRQNGFVRRYVMPEIVAWCRERGIPTVFYNKEDPSNFDVFIDAARLFDFVFTSDANCVDDYRKLLGHERIFALPFAAQPSIHNPLAVGEGRTQTVCFAGSWYAHRHFNRQREAEIVIKPALAFGLHIFDRNARLEDPSFSWPGDYRAAVKGTLSYAQLLAAYKRYKVFLNINSVADSPTMFSRRVFELLACGTPVVSAFSLGIEQVLGTDVVLMSTDVRTTTEYLEKLLSDDEYRDRLALRGLRAVLGQHTYSHRLDRVLSTIGLDVPAVAPPAIHVWAPVESAAHAAGAVANFRRQHYPHKRLVLVAATQDAVEGLERSVGADLDVTAVIQGAQAAVSGTALPVGDAPVAVMNPVDYYGPHYLSDLVQAIAYSDADVIGKATHYAVRGTGRPQIQSAGHEFRWVDELCPWTCLARPTALQQILNHFPPNKSFAAAWQLAAARTRGLALDRFGYVHLEAATPPANGRSLGGEAASDGRLARALEEVLV